MSQELPDHIWLVQYNLTGLQQPVYLTRSEEADYWWSSDGEIGEKDSSKLPKDYEEFNLVRRFRRTKVEADALYNELNNYRKFIKRHL